MSCDGVDDAALIRIASATGIQDERMADILDAARKAGVDLSTADAATLRPLFNSVGYPNERADWFVRARERAALDIHP